MNRRFATNLMAAWAAWAFSQSVLAHDGHGLDGAHWHASDAWGLVAAAALVVVAVWLTRGK